MNPSGVKRASSKYDFVKVRVWLSDDDSDTAPAHHYVLSRFLVSRVLTVTKMRYHDAIRLALELKKQLVDQQRLDLPQHEMEASLFGLMAVNGYGGEYIRRFRMMSAFHRQRVPLIILLSGTGCIGKSTLATQLAERLNLPNVLQTDLVRMLLHTTKADCGEGEVEGGGGGGRGSRSSREAGTEVRGTLSAPHRLWTRRFGTAAQMLDEHRQEASSVCDAVKPDLQKALADGKVRCNAPLLSAGNPGTPPLSTAASRATRSRSSSRARTYTCICTRRRSGRSSTARPP